jgi:hypothetical protein
MSRKTDGRRMSMTGQTRVPGTEVTGIYGWLVKTASR